MWHGARRGIQSATGASRQGVAAAGRAGFAQSLTQGSVCTEHPGPTLQGAEWNTERFRSASLRPQCRSASGEMEDAVSRFLPARAGCVRREDAALRLQHGIAAEHTSGEEGADSMKDKAKPYLAADGFS